MLRLDASAPVRAGLTRDAEVATQVDPDDGVPLLLRGAHEHAVPDDAGVVHHHVEPAEALDRLLDHRAGLLPVRHVGAVRDGLAARSPDLRHHLVGRRARAALALERDADVVDHDRGALPGELEGVRATEAASRAGDDDDPSFADTCHASSSC
jgi:hypothetical protein